MYIISWSFYLYSHFNLYIQSIFTFISKSISKSIFVYIPIPIPIPIPISISIFYFMSNIWYINRRFIHLCGNILVRRDYSHKYERRIFYVSTSAT